MPVAAAEAESVEDVADVVLDRARRDEQLIVDRPVGQSRSANPGRSIEGDRERLAAPAVELVSGLDRHLGDAGGNHDTRQ